MDMDMMEQPLEMLPVLRLVWMVVQMSSICQVKYLLIHP